MMDDDDDGCWMMDAGCWMLDAEKLKTKSFGMILLVENAIQKSKPYTPTPR